MKNQPNEVRMKQCLEGCLLLVGISFLMLVWICAACLGDSAEPGAAAYFPAAVFWISLALEAWLVWCCGRMRTEMEQQRGRVRSLEKSRPGVISFRRNREAAIADLVMAVSAGLLLLLAVLPIPADWPQVVCILSLYLSFNLHCILNGKNYRYFKAFAKYVKEHEQDE